MGSTIQLTTSDGHTLDAYRVEPEGVTKGSVVVIQEIFGVNQHIRNLCEEYAKNGYVAIAPALFDRAEKGLDLGYGQDDFAKGRDTRMGLDEDGIKADVQAAIDEAGKTGKVGIVGYRSEEHTSELQSLVNLVCRLLLEKKKQKCIPDGVA